MELHQIRYFLALCEELNFTRAAERCGVAQSSLTRAIKALEQELGGALFHRERANTHLSGLGRQVQPLLEQAYGHVDDARRQARDFLRAQSAILRLGLMCTIAPARLLELVAALRAHHPEIALQLADDTAEALHRRLLAGELDAAIYTVPALADDERLDTTPLYRELFVAVLHPAHRVARLDVVRLKDLSAEPYLWRTHCEVLAQSESLREAMGPAVYRSGRDDWILAMAAAGVGYAVMPAFSAEYPGTVARPLVEPAIARDIALVVLRGRQDTQVIGALMREAMQMRWMREPMHAAMPELPAMQTR